MKKTIALVALVSASGMAFGQRTGDDQAQSMSMAHQLSSPANESQSINPGNFSSINKSGDLSASLPLITVSGKQLKLPINLSYQAGIRVDQKASEVGLGWNVSFGSITRDYGAFEPDYYETGVETDMINENTDIPGELSTTNTNFINTIHRTKPLVYQGLDGTDTEKMTSDLYRINLPGKGSNSFWNNGSADGVHDMVWQKFQNWRIEHSPKTYTIAQEISRINEINNSVASTSNNRSFAAAIAIPPYVTDRQFSKLVENNSFNSQFTQITGALTVSYQDFGEFIITDEQGVKYIFGRALRGQKFLLNEDPYWSTIKGQHTNFATVNQPQGSVFGEFWKIDFIAEWLLTEVRALDYVDENNNGFADDGDLGDWIRIEYTDAHQTESFISGQGQSTVQNVPKHREWSNFSRTDKASSLMRERAYVTKISTPVEEYTFDISERFDVDHDYFSVSKNNGAIGATNADRYFYAKKTFGYPTLIEYPVEVMRYDKITHKAKFNNQMLNTIEFNYATQGSSEQLAVSDYLILKNDKTENNSADYDVSPDDGFIFDVEDYNTGDARGKTTLLGLTIYPENNLTSSQAQKYSFEYAKNPSFNAVHKHEVIKAEEYPSIRCSYSRPEFQDKNFIPTLYPFEIINNVLGTPHANVLLTDNQSSACATPLGHYRDPHNPSAFNADAWSLTKITLPQGGTISFEYEQDETNFTTTMSILRPGNSLIPNRLPSILNYNRAAAIKGALQSFVNNDFGIGEKTLSPVFKAPDEFYGLRLKRKSIDDNHGNISQVNYEYGTGYHTYIPRSYWQTTISAFSGFMQYQFINQENISRYKNELNSEVKGYLITGDQAQLFWEGTELRDNDFTTFLQTLQPSIRFDHNVGDDSHFYTYIDELYNDGSKKRKHYDQVVSSGNYEFDPVTQKSAFLKGFFLDEGNVVEMITNTEDPRREIVLKKVEWFATGENQASLVENNYYEFDIKAIKENNFPEKTFNTNRQLLYNYEGGEIAIETHTDPDEPHEALSVPFSTSSMRSNASDLFLSQLPNIAQMSLDELQAGYLNKDRHPGSMNLGNYIVREAEYQARYISNHTRMTKKEVIDFRSLAAGSNTVTQTTQYHFDNDQLASPSRVEKTTSQDPEVYRVIHSLYPTDYTNLGGFIGDMKNANILQPIEVVQSILDKSTNSYQITAAQYNRYYEVGEHIGLLKNSHTLNVSSPIDMANFSFSNRVGSGYNEIPPSGSNSTFYPSSLYNTTELTNSFHEGSRHIKSTESKVNPLISYKYGYDNAFPIVQIIGAESDEVTTQNFEDPSLQHSNDAYCGDQSYNLFGDSPALLRTNIKENVKQDGDYTLSFHYKNDGLVGSAVVMIRLFRYPNQPNQTLITNNMPLFQMNNTQGKWKMLRETIDIPALKTANGIPLSEEVGIRIQLVNYDQNVPILVDDWRFYPSEAQLTTYTYKPLRGISSITDARGETQNFSYDGFGRLIETKDAEGKLLQTTDYNTIQP